MNIIWFKNDLRYTDHPAMAMASATGKPALCVYIIEPNRWAQPDMSDRHYDFLRASIIDLNTQLVAHYQRLYVFWGEAVDIFNHLHQQITISSLFSHQETGNLWTYRRDNEIALWASIHGITWHQPPQNGVIRRLRNRDGWARAWQDYMTQPPAPTIIPPHPQGLLITDHTPPPTIQTAQTRIQAMQPAGHAIAMQYLESFLGTRSQSYSTDMSSPITGETACSRLSPYLAIGTLSLRQVYQRTLLQVHTLNNAPPSPAITAHKRSIRAFMSRLQWHCHFIQKYEDDPRIEYQSLHSAYRHLDDMEHDPDWFAAWATGCTGFPFVDACMRFLIHHGWLNFRMRAMMVSVGVHHLQLAWTQCAHHLARLFTDYEPGIHYSQCQMQAGRTGINTIRIYNPIKQGYDQDPDGTFIRRWLPELASVPNSGIHEPWYYGHAKPLVDEKIARKNASSRLYAIRKTAGFTDEAQRIYIKHGSRKNRSATNSKKRP